MAQKAEMINSIGMKFVLIKPGSFILGKFQPPYPTPKETAKAGTQQGQDTEYTPAQYKLAQQLATQDAKPGFQVTITKPFYIGAFEVTQAQWQQVMGTNSSIFQGNKVSEEAGNHPVENVTWQEAQAFLKKLTQLEGGKVRYRLPTEFEWEYAARAGATDDIAWEEIRLAAQMGLQTTAPVGQKKPNAWGLYDTLGNVWEWVDDYYNEKLFADRVPPKSGKVHVLKGASFVGDVKNATYMTHAAGPGNGWDVGFRVVMEIND
ncbi:formylglycine-generating enzyme family protein [Rhodocytophaga aerolata]|uniref:Formylglycine-generating enzyme family protein n=1 Tax=Rhodocytophaga aerolata TaxID=455078 RepID=A0ABT8R361_9BACT|nr:formylglycine-generating enzyme family protein [Rhodocytophaga aerolata]MDO1446551.1 formylglycine-generating enzyme family protein [Rhodocytophaga aerolata]